jgi:hypothetical protein
VLLNTMWRWLVSRNNQAKRKAKKKLKVLQQKQAETKKLSPNDTKRACNGCTECCSVLGVKPIDKAPWVSCEHLCEAGCAIYLERPGICGEFNCLWQCGLGTMDERPDNLGVIFAPTAGPLPFTGETEIQLYEAQPGAMSDPRVMKICNKLVKGGALIIGMPHGTEGIHRFMGPKKKVLAAQIAAQLSANRESDSD